MIKLAAISPRTNSFNVQEGDSSPESMQYERLFSEMAHASLGAKSPQLAEAIQHFKVISTDLDSDSAVGVFICDLQVAKIHVPIVLAQGKVKPPEVFYMPEMDRYLPLTTKWLAEVSSGRVGELGKATDTRKMQFGASSLSEVTSPPSSRNKFSSYDLPVLLSRTPNRTKTSMSNFLKNNTGVLRRSVKYHGKDIVTALTKTAAKEKLSRKSWVILDSNSKADTFKKYFGKYASQAFQESQIHGLAYLDYRKNAGGLLKVSSKSEIPSTLSEPRDSGIYKIMKANGSYVRCLIISSPVPVNSADRMSEYKYLVILENGDYLETDSVVAVPSAESLDSESMIYKRLEGLTVKNGLQSLVRYSEGVLYNASSPVTLENVTTRQDDVQTATAGSKNIVFNSPTSTTSIHAPEGESVVFVPKSYKSLPLRNKLDTKAYVTDASQAVSLINSGVSKQASRKITLRNNSLGDWVLNGKSYTSKKEALFKMASMGCALPDAYKAIKQSKGGKTYSFNVVPKGNYIKLSSIFGPDTVDPYGMAAQPQLPPDMGQQQMQQQQPEMDPQTGEPIDPTTGLPIDPNSGMPYNPETGALVDPQTGQELDPETGEPLPSPEEQQIMEEAARANDQMVLDSSMAATLLSDADMPELTLEYLPKLETSLDSIGRILLTIQMKQELLTEKVGLEEFAKLESSLKRVSIGLGDIILRLKNATKVVTEANNGEFQ
jgi:hypothetical protein